MIIKKSIQLPLNLLLGRLALFIGAVSIFGWTLKVFRHHFDFHPSDLLPLALCFVVPFFLMRALGLKVRIPALLTATILNVLIIGLLPISRWLLSFSDYSWGLCYLTLLISGILLFSWGKSWRFLPLTLAVVWMLPFQFDSTQGLYFDRLVSSQSTRKAEIHEVSWKSEKWHYVNGKPEFSTVDQHLYFESLVHPILHLSTQGDVLLIGGDNKQALSEIRKFSHEVEWIPWDRERVRDKNHASILQSIAAMENRFSAIVIDLPDPVTLQLNEFYTQEFYSICRKALKEDGFLVTQSLSPYSKSGLSQIIENTLQSAGFHTVQYHNQVPTLGQWSWTLGAKSGSTSQVRTALSELRPRATTVWWNEEAMQMMLNQGKTQFFHKNDSSINTIEAPLLHVAMSSLL